MEIENALVSSVENMKSALDISNALPEAKGIILCNLFCELKRLFENVNRVTYDYDEDFIKQYYFSRKQLYPYLSVEIKKLSEDLMVGSNMYYGFAFTEVDKDGRKCV